MSHVIKLKSEIGLEKKVKVGDESEIAYTGVKKGMEREGWKGGREEIRRRRRGFKNAHCALALCATFSLICSTTAGSASVLRSPSWSPSPATISRIIRLMIYHKMKHTNS